MLTARGSWNSKERAVSPGGSSGQKNAATTQKQSE